MPLKPIAKDNKSRNQKGSITLPWQKGEITWFPDEIYEIRYNQSEKDLIELYLKSDSDNRTFVNHAGFDDIVPVFQDMMKRALKGQCAHYQDYNKDGSRKTKRQKAFTAPRPKV